MMGFKTSHLSSAFPLIASLTLLIAFSACDTGSSAAGGKTKAGGAKDQREKAKAFYFDWSHRRSLIDKEIEFVVERIALLPREKEFQDEEPKHRSPAKGPHKSEGPKQYFVIEFVILVNGQPYKPGQIKSLGPIDVKIDDINLKIDKPGPKHIWKYTATSASRDMAGWVYDYVTGFEKIPNPMPGALEVTLRATKPDNSQAQVTFTIDDVPEDTWLRQGDE